jgi:hypothetical protein
LVSAGWLIAGHGYGDGCTNIRKLIDRFRPAIVFVNDKRDWSTDSPGCLDPRVSFRQIELLAKYSKIAKATVVKDAGSMRDFQQRFCLEIDATAVVIYYHPRNVLRQSEWLSKYPLIRTYHSVDAMACQQLDLHLQRRRAAVSGALSDIYPLRKRIFQNAETIGCEHINHPGYGNKRCHTTEYLRLLCQYRVSIATASRFGFALRKIIESVACGCAVVTNLPKHDILPKVDEFLVRVPTNATIRQIKGAVDQANENWSTERAIYYARLAQSYYDFRRLGNQLSKDLLHTYKSQRLPGC